MHGTCFSRGAYSHP